MFDSLADRIKADEQLAVNKTERVIKWTAVLVLSILVFGGLFFGVRLLE